MKTPKGFTLIELLVVLALIAILAAILIVIIKPAEIFKRGRNIQRIGDLRNLAAATDVYINELASGATNLLWPTRGTCSSTSPGNIFFSITTAPPNGWPALPAGATATGTANTTVDGNGWVPLNFANVTLLNFPRLPLDPRNGQIGCGPNGNMACAYEFSCTTGQLYEYAAALEGTPTDDGGNQANLYEVGPGANTLY